MKQINNGYADYYYLCKDGSLYNANTKKITQPGKDHTYKLKTTDNKRKKIALKTLYKLVYNEQYCIDNIKNLDNEEWKVIDNTDNIYYVSNKGRIKSYHRYEAIILKSCINNKGYARVDIVEGGLRQTKLIHRLVAAAFLDMPEKIDMQLHHIDFNKMNNAASNLKWLTAADHLKVHQERNINNVKSESTEPESNNSK